MYLLNGSLSSISSYIVFIIVLVHFFFFTYYQKKCFLSNIYSFKLKKNEKKVNEMKTLGCELMMLNNFYNPFPTTRITIFFLGSNNKDFKTCDVDYSNYIQKIRKKTRKLNFLS